MYQKTYYAPGGQSQWQKPVTGLKVGARVEKGQRLGTVGDTGIATGPHLHWGLFVHGCCVDPYMWMNSSSAHRLIF